MVVTDWLPEIGFSGSRNQLKNGFKESWTRLFFIFWTNFLLGIFDDLSKFRSVLGLLHFEKNHQIWPKNWQKMKKIFVQLAYNLLNTPQHFQNLKPWVSGIRSVTRIRVWFQKNRLELWNGLKFEKKLQFKEAPKSKIDVFWRKKIHSRSPSGTLHSKKFQNPLILASEENSVLSRENGLFPIF